jgi:hypothetical protein
MKQNLVTINYFYTFWGFLSDLNQFKFSGSSDLKKSRLFLLKTNSVTHLSSHKLMIMLPYGKFSRIHNK